jgi:hypothetical protein
MSPKLINQKQTERYERVKHVINELLDCKTVEDLNDFSQLFYREMKWPEVSKQFAAAAKRITAVETIKNFNNKN